jgi:hypothetical protein
MKAIGVVLGAIVLDLNVCVYCLGPKGERAFACERCSKVTYAKRLGAGRVAKEGVEATVDHLWEAKHAYYCNDANYYSRDTINKYPSWETFLEAEGDCDPDYNLLFRWDWSRKEKILRLYWMGQRKGLFRSTMIMGMHADEEASVREWLEKRWQHLASLWAPLSGVNCSPFEQATYDDE